MKYKLLLFVFLPCLSFASAIINPGGGTSTGGGIVSPGTFTWTNTYGMSLSTVTVTSTATLAYVTASSTINATNFSGGGLATCGSTSQAESYSATTGLFGCTTITAAGLGALTGNQTITLSGPVTGTGATSITTSLTATGVGANNYGSATVVPVITFGADGRLTSVSSATISASGGSGYALEPSTVSVQLAKGIYVGTNTISATSYAITSTDTVIFANGTLGSTATYTLPKAASACKNGTGQTIQITKVDSSTGPVKLLTTGTDLISGSTNSLLLNAVGQTDELVSDCKSNWWPYGIGIQYTPTYISVGPGIGTGAFTTAASSDIVTCAFTVPIPIAVTGIRFNVNTAGPANTVMAWGIDDVNGIVLGSSQTVAGVLVDRKNYTLATPLNIPPGQYNLAFQLSNQTATIAGQSNASGSALFCSKVAQSNVMGIVNMSFGTGAAKNFQIDITVAGGRTTE